MYTSKLEVVATVNRARYEMFKYSGKDFGHIPPTKNALKLHTLLGTPLAMYKSKVIAARLSFALPLVMYLCYDQIYLLQRSGDMK